ncbi:MAG: S9 family peptidase [Deltaproteobacteria bacterium]|nr:MAG: S9 family peptidase [Deltaproteobacteria bacterium]
MARRLLSLRCSPSPVLPVVTGGIAAGLVGAVLAGCGGPRTAPAPAEPVETPEPADAEAPFLWLEDVDGEDALAWVREQNERSLARIEAHPLFAPIREEALEVLTSDEGIPWPTLRGGQVYNFWRDATHERGIWRVTSPEDYATEAPDWTVLLDVDALAEEEDENWVWAGSACLEPDHDRCIVSLSIGGADAAVRREFDLPSRTFVEDGFRLPESKSRIAWRDRDTVFLAPAFTDDDMTTSGYPRRVLLWSRGTPREDATPLFEGEREDVSVWGTRFRDGDEPWDLVGRARTFFTRDYHLLLDDELVHVPIPDDAVLVGIMDRHLLVELKSDWTTGGTTFPQGALLSAPVEGLTGDGLVFSTLFAPGPRQSIDRILRTENTLLVSILDNVRARILRFTRVDGAWQQHALAVPELGTVRLLTADDRSDLAFYQYADFLTPPSVVRLAADEDTHETVRNEPTWFDADGMAVEQREAISADGTRIPYFLVTPAGFEPRGTHPTLLAAYGGFEISRTPFYSGVMGRAWLARGGVYVVANIRGGGEFGPAWHRAALRENRQRSFDDLIAVAETLIDNGITSPDHLGIQGGSNGGLLVGAVMVQRPELFGAVVSAVPLLDMLRYHRLLAGASWMAEYGNPDDPEDRAFLEAYSPLQNLRADTTYPTPFIWTSTRDDRVHPGHARRMVARMLELGHDVLYYENIEGGHGGAANQPQRAYIAALTWAYLWKQLAADGALDAAD